MQALSIKTIMYVVAMVAVLSYGVAGTYVLGREGNFHGFNPNKDTFVNATYYTVVTLATVGYGDITPATPIAKIFVITLILAGLGVFLSAVAVIGGEFMNSRIETLTGRVSAFEKRLFNRHIVLIGTNSTNLYLAEKLKERGDRFVIVTSDKDKSDQLRGLGFSSFVADATSDMDMMKFNLDKAKMIVIDVKDSSRTIYVLLVAKSLAKDRKIVALVPTEEAARHIRSLHVATMIINPSDIAAREISNVAFSEDDKKHHGSS